MMLIKYSNIRKIIEEAKSGKMFILVDDESRENEGDLVIPASKATAKSPSRWIFTATCYQAYKRPPH